MSENSSKKDLIIRCGFSTIKFGNVFRESTLAKGEALRHPRNHVINAEEILRPGKFPEINGYCLPQTKINNPPYKLSISLDASRTINGFMCNCVAGAGAIGDGQLSACKHIAALALHINKEREESSKFRHYTSKI